MSFPDGPKSPPLWRMLRWIFNPLDLLDEYAQTYGDIFGFVSQLNGSVVYLTDPEALQTLFSSDAEFLCGGQSNGVMRPMLGDYSVVLLDGAAHAHQRKLLMPHFHGEQMRAYGSLIQTITQQTLTTWPQDQPFAARPALQRISLQVILEAVFGMRTGPRCDQLVEILETILNGFESELSSFFLFFRWLQKDLGPLTPWGRFLRLKAKLDQLLYTEIAERRALLVQESTGRSDVLSMLILATDETGTQMTDVELRDELITLLIAGHETTASAMTWALYWLATRPDVKTQLLTELNTLGPDVDPYELTRLPYLNAVCQETLRIYPISIMGFPRILQQPMTLKGYQLEAGTVLVPSIYLAHHRPSVYPDPKHFQPERFLERTFSPYEFLPFGGGRRTCIGQAFAMYEMKLVVATIMQQVDLKVVSPKPVKPCRRGLTIATPPDLKFQVAGFRPIPSVSEGVTTYV